MIHPKAVKLFLKQQRDSHAWMKKLTNKQLDRALEEQGFKVADPTKKPLRKQQKVCILLGLAYPRFSFWLDMGLGKTRIVLELMNHYWRLGLLKRGLILCISDEAVDEWEKQFRKWGVKIPHVGIGNSATVEKWQHVAELGAGLIIATYAGFNHMFASRQKTTKRTKRRKAKVKMSPDAKKIKAFAANLDAFVMDESVHLGNYKGLGFRIAKKLSAKCYSVHALAGVPFGLDPTLIWSQQFLVDRGETLGPTLGLFRGGFFEEKAGHFTMFEYKFKKEMEPVLHEILQHRSITYSTEDAGIELPPVTPIVRSIRLPPETMALYEKALEQLKQAAIRHNRRQMENSFLRMRQLSSGFIGYADDETGAKAQLILPQNPKLDDFVNNIEDMPYDCKFVCFYEFTVSGRALVEALAKRGITAGWVWSGTKDVKKVRRLFDDAPPKKFKGIIGNWRKIAESLNLQRANYTHYFESPVGVIARRQSEKRTDRLGQERPGFRFDYCATSADRRILQFHKSGADFFKALFRDPDEALGEQPRRKLAA